MADDAVALPAGFKLDPGPAGALPQGFQLDAPPIDMSPVKQMVERNLAASNGPREARTFGDAFEAGLQISVGLPGVGGLTGRGKAPDIGLPEKPGFGLRAGAMLGQVAGDLPAMVAGFALGAPAGGPTPMGAVTGTAGAFALPAGMRATLMDAYTKGSFTTFEDFWQRSMGIMWDTAKGWITGAATGGAGVVAKAALPIAAPAAVQVAAPTAAELATMVTVGNALEGHLPTMQDFADAAIVLGGVKAAGGTAASLRKMYADSAARPNAVVEAAVKDSQVWQETLDGTPRPAEVAPAPQSQAQRAKAAGIVEKTEEAANDPQKRPASPKQMSDEEYFNAVAFMERPFAEVPQAPGEPARPTHLNYNRIETTEQAKQALSSMSEFYEAKIQAERRPGTTWEQSQAEAGQVLADLLKAPREQVMSFMEGKEASASGTAQLLARKEMAISMAEDLMRARASLSEKGANASPEDVGQFLAQVERTSTAVATFLGKRADTARALNALKSTARESERMKDLLEVINGYGGQGKIGELMNKLGEYSDPAQALAFAREATKATTWEKMMEGWRAGLVSGLRTHEVNMLSNSVFTALRIPTQFVTAIYGTLHGGEKAYFAESMGMAVGAMKGVMDAARVGSAAIRTAGKESVEIAKDENMGVLAKMKEVLRTVIGSKKEGEVTKAEQHRPAIEGGLGEAIRTPFRLLSAEDQFFKTLAGQQEAYALATRKAITEGLKYGEKDFNDRVVDLAQNDATIAEASKAAADRYTFNTPLGEAGKSFQQFVRSWHLELLFPFIRTPGNIFKETARMVPGTNFLVKEWNADYEAGGVRRDKALAEVTVGTALMSAVVAAVFNGNVTGGGVPDAREKATDRAAGWRPYAVKVGGTYVEGYIRMAPVGQLVGLAADSAEFWKYMTSDEHDKWARMLAFAFAQNVTNQSFMQGMTQFVNVLADPQRYGENYFESLAGSVVPGFLAQIAQGQDPYVREVHGMLEAIRSRIPYMREGIMPKRDIFGEPITNPERLWAGSPFSVSHVPDDRVRTEAMRAGFATAPIPKKMDVLPGLKGHGLDMVELTAEQRDVFASEAGQIAHKILEPMVNTAGWDDLPKILRRQQYELAFAKGREIGQIAALNPEDRAKAVQKALAKYTAALDKRD